MGNPKDPARYKQGFFLTKDNRLVRMQGNMTPMSYKLINYFLWRAAVSGENEDLEVNATQLVSKLHIGDRSLGKVLEAECEKAAKTIVKFQDKENPDEDWAVMSLVPIIRYQKGVLTAKVNKDVMPYINELRGNFTPLQLKTVNQFETYPSMRLYEVCASWKRAGCVTYTVEEWKGLLGAKGKSYDEFWRFRSRVWNPAVKAVNERTEFHIEDSFKKRGRKTTHITIHITEIKTIEAHAVSENKKRIKSLLNGVVESVSINPRMEPAEALREAPSASNGVFQNMLSLGFSKDVAKTYLEKYGEDYCKAQVDVTLAAEKAGNVQNPAGYLRRALDEDFAGEREKQAAIIAREEQAKKENEQRDREAQEFFHGKTESAPEEPEAELKAAPLPEADAAAAGYWQAVVSIMQSPLYGMPTAAAKKWLVPCVPVSAENGTLRLVAPNEFARDWINKRYLPSILKSAAALGFHAVVCIANEESA